MSEKDSRQNGGNEPPDLEQVWRDFRNRIEGSSPNSPISGGQNLKKAVLVILGVVLALWLASGFYMIDAREEGVVLRFGQYDRVTGAGLQWHIPYPFESVEVVRLTEVRSVEIGYRGNDSNRVPEEALMVTSDLNIIDVQFSVQYDVLNSREFLFQNTCNDVDCRDQVKQVAEAAIREIVGHNQVDFVLNEGRAKIATDTQNLIQQIINLYKLGIRISKVNINNVQPPEPVLAAFDDAVKAGQDKDKLRNEGQAYANDVIPRAQGVAARLLQEAEGYKQRVIANAEGETSRFNSVFAEYQKAPAVMRERLYLDTMQSILSSSSKIYVDQKNGQNLLYLPLDKLMQQTASAPVPAARPENSTAPTELAPAETSEVTRRSTRSGREVNRDRTLAIGER